MLSTKLPDTVVLFPKQAQIEPVAQCNLRCQMCSIRFRSTVPGDGPAFMDPGLFTDLVDQLHGVEELHLQGLGEPLLHPSFFDMVSYASRRGIKVTTNSNMTMFNEERAEECVRSGLSWVRVSIDGATAKTYEAIRVGSRLEQVLKNVAMLRRARQRAGSSRPRLFLVMVIMKKNMAELPDVVRLAGEYGMEQMFVQHLCHDLSKGVLPGQYQSMHDFVEEQTLIGADRQRVQAYFNAALALAGQLKIELRLPHIGLRRHPAAGSGKKRCDWPWRSAYLAYDGTAMPCCMIGLPERMNFGNAAEKGFSNIWNGEEYRRFRSQLGSGETPAICRTCSVYQGTF